MKLSDKDRKELREMVNLYGAKKVTATLYESSYWSGGRSSNFISQMRSPGVSKSWNGKKGLIKSIPSLLFTAVLSLPLACVLALGAVNARLRQKWESGNSWTNKLLNPSNFFEWFATGNYKKNKNGYYDDDDSFFSRRSKESEHRNINDKDSVTDSSISALSPDSTGLTVDGSILNIDGKQVSTQEALSYIDSKAFTLYWILLSNGEVLKYRAPNEEFAKFYANAYITNNAYEKYKKAGTVQLQNCSYYPYECVFDDGQVLQCAAKTKEDAAKSAKSSMAKLTQASNEYSGNSFVTLPDMKAPELTEVNRLSISEFAMPDSNNYKITKTQPARKKQAVSSKLLYDYGPFEEYKINVPIADNGFSISLHIPASTPEQACEIAKRYADNQLQRYAILINSMKPARDNAEYVYTVTTGDHDRYIIPAENENEAKRIAGEFLNNKIITVSDVLREGSGRANAEFDNLIRTNAELFRPRNYRVSEKTEKFELVKQIKIRKEFDMTVSKCVRDTDHTDRPIFKTKVHVK